MSAVPYTRVLRRIPYLLGGSRRPSPVPLPRRALPALFLPLPPPTQQPIVVASSHTEPSDDLVADTAVIG
jgi:hypothetical protein